MVKSNWQYWYLLSRSDIGQDVLYRRGNRIDITSSQLKCCIGKVLPGDGPAWSLSS